MPRAEYDRRAWLDERRKGIGGSEISAILGLDPFRGPLDVYLAKVEGHDSPDNPDMERGRFLEGAVADWYAHREGVSPSGNAGVAWHPVTDFQTTHPNGIARCTPDRLIWLEPGVVRDLSIKAPRRGGDQWGEHSGSHRIPAYCATQLQWEDAVLTAANPGTLMHPLMHLAALVDGELRIYHCERDTELQALLLTEAEKWWQKHVVGKVPPELDDGDGAKQWLRRRFPKDLQPVRAASLEEEVLLAQLSEAAKALAGAEKAYEIERRRTEEAIGEAGGIEGSAARVTWRATGKNGTRRFLKSFPWEKT